MRQKTKEIKNYFLKNEFHKEKKGVLDKTYDKWAVKFRICSKGIYINIKQPTWNQLRAQFN